MIAEAEDASYSNSMIGGRKVKRRLFVDGNTVYGIDEECMEKKRKKKEKELQSYLLILMCAAYKASLKDG